MMMMSAENTAAFAAVECNMITPCTAPPPNGAPRYVLPSSQYDPAKAAEERFAKALVLEEEEATKKRNFEMMKMKAEEEEEEKEEEASKAPEEEVVDSSTDSTASSSSFEE